MSEPGIVKDAETGEAVIAGTNVTVAEVLRELASGPGVEAVLRSHPELTAESVVAAVEFATTVLQRETPYALPDAGQVSPGVREIRAAYGEMTIPSLGEKLRTVEEEYARRRYELEVLDGIREGLQQIAAGQGIPHDEVMARARARLSR